MKGKRLGLTVLFVCLLLGSTVSATEKAPEPTKLEESSDPTNEKNATIRGAPDGQKKRLAQPRYNFNSYYTTSYDFNGMQIYTDGWVQNLANKTESLKFFFSPAYGDRRPIQWLPTYRLRAGQSTSMRNAASIKNIVKDYTENPDGFFYDFRLDSNQDCYYVSAHLDAAWHQFGLGLTFGGDNFDPNSNWMRMGRAIIYDPIVKYALWFDSNSQNVYDEAQLLDGWSVPGFEWNNLRYSVSKEDRWVHLNGLSMNGKKTSTVIRIPGVKQYTVRYDGNTGVTKAKSTTTWAYKDTRVSQDIPTKEGYTFTGWNTKADGTGSPYNTNGTITARSLDLLLYAQYKPNPYTITFDKNNPEKALVDGSDISMSAPSLVSHYDSPWGTLATASKPGYLFQGWFTQPENGTQILNTTICKGDLTVYAHWKPVTYLLRFHPNAENGTGDVAGHMSAVTLTYDQVTNLPLNTYKKTRLIPSEDEGGAVRTLPSIFLGWGLDPKGLQPAWADQAKVLNLTKKEGTIFDLYAIWDDAPSFIVDAYPDRYFTLDEAKNGTITERELLETVVVYDRETNPLPKKDSAEVSTSGNDRGITVVGYDSDEFTTLNDDATVLIRYQVKDDAGNETFLNINVHISRNGAVQEEQIAYYRSISSAYHDKEPQEGGLSVSSYWRTDEEAYGALLKAAMQDQPLTLYDITLGKNLLSQIRGHVKEHGFGKSLSQDGLENVWHILGEEVS